MTARRLSQTAAVLAMRALYAEAAALLTRAVALIDRDGVDRDLRAGLVARAAKLAGMAEPMKGGV